MLDFIKKIIEFLTGSLQNMQITAFSNNKKSENNVDESFVSGPVQQAKIINNTYNNLQDNKEKSVAKTEDQIEEEKRFTRDEELRIEKNRRNYKDNSNYDV